MIPPSRAVAFAKADVRGHSLTSDLCPLTSGLAPNTENTSAAGRIRSGEQRITDNQPNGASAFTLIEMTVVILIIILLAGFIFTAGSGVFDRARKVQAKNDVTQLVTAVNAYYTEYGKYPVTVTNNTTDAFFGSGAAPAGCTSYTTNDKLLNVLRYYTGGSDAANVTLLNPRQIVFIAPPTAKTGTLPRGGISQTAGTVGQYMDPWGSRSAIVIDTTYDNQIGTANPYSDTDGSAGASPLLQGVIAYSFGKNGALGGGAAVSSSFAAETGSAGKFKGSSDILSWQ